MKAGDLVQAADKTFSQTVWEGIGVLIRPDEGRTYVEWTNSWEMLCNDGILRVIDGSDIEVISIRDTWKELVEVIDESR
jgi:hypothetical protein